MDTVKCEVVGRDPGMCVCEGPTLSILKDVQKAYEAKMELLDKSTGTKKLQMQVDLLRSWVGDLVGQNTLLARAVEDLETEATTRLLAERRKNNEMVCEVRAEAAALRRRLARKDADLRGLVEVLRRLREFDYCSLEGIHFFEVTESDIFGSVEWRQKKMEEGDVKQNLKQYTSKLKGNRHHKEIMRLNKDVQQYEQVIMNLRSEMSLSTCYQSQNVSKKDAEVMAGMCCTGTEMTPTCGDWEPVKDGSLMQREETQRYHEQIRKMEASLKSSGSCVRELRAANASLAGEASALRRACGALAAEARAAAARAHFKDDIIREMRRQLKQAKAKLKEASEPLSLTTKDYVSGDHDFRSPSVSYDSVTIACVRQQPRRKRDVPPAAPLVEPLDAPLGEPLAARSDTCRTARLRARGSGDDVLSIKSDYDS